MRAARALGIALSLGLLAPGSGAAAAAPAKAARADWSRKFSVTPEGGYRMGNPGARIAIVEYASLVCPHCRHFAQTSMRPLVAGYVRTGKASYEFRPLILSGLDVAATLVARCSGPSRFFPIAETLYATQPTWTGRIDQDQYAKLLKLPEGEMFVSLARLTGLTRVAAGHGIAAPRAEACLRNKAGA
jgi:protein-disulfide isomerase